MRDFVMLIVSIGCVVAGVVSSVSDLTVHSRERAADVRATDTMNGVGRESRPPCASDPENRGAVRVSSNRDCRAEKPAIPVRWPH